ncbi:hypothetical protein GCM10009555_084940 [Acrocarpospora macrocephala]|uniref:Uncharacterized protein n=1 Tax=Acrocarpospora macrocephala TaxID=150177 RepID=A0A5M3X0W4_9ACTN|nr:hypothetical protein [Acrocarpospora macrocephala]GES14252.1 hypothetical protein Amac_078490 [Acrocarpospora macrocephala]
MRVNAWRVVGGAFTAFVVISAAMIAHSELLWNGGLDGSAPTTLISAHHSETLTEVYAFDEPILIVRAGDGVQVNIVPGTDKQLTIRRELSWTGDDSPNLRQFWNGRTLRADVSCRDSCTAAYTLSVPSNVKVERPDGSPVAPGIP